MQAMPHVRTRQKEQRNLGCELMACLKDATRLKSGTDSEITHCSLRGVIEVGGIILALGSP